MSTHIICFDEAIRKHLSVLAANSHYLELSSNIECYISLF